LIVYISGHSAGAQLTAATILYIRDSLHAADKISGVVLGNGIFDLGETPSHRNATDSTPGLNKHAYMRLWNLCLASFQ